MGCRVVKGEVCFQERNLTAWAEQRLTELCTTECLVQMKNWRCEVTSVKNEGHVSSALRKGPDHTLWNRRSLSVAMIRPEIDWI